MNKWKNRMHRVRWGVVYAVVLTAFTLYGVLDTFLIPHAYSSSDNSAETSYTGSVTSDSSDSTVTDTSYESDGVKITISTNRYKGTTVYVADIEITDITALRTAFADGTYGRNITETTSAIAEENNAVLAINGDYYGAQNSGYVIRNGTLYRSTVRSDSQEDFVIYMDGTTAVIEEGNISADQLIEDGAWQVFSFGPSLISDGTITVSENEEVGKAMTSNPRTAIGQISENHYVLVVGDGRTSESEGLSLYQLAAYMQDLGVTTAYNLDGGGSSTMYFNGQVINQPTTNGNTISEREVSDIVYI